MRSRQAASRSLSLWQDRSWDRLGGDWQLTASKLILKKRRNSLIEFGVSKPTMATTFDRDEQGRCSSRNELLLEGHGLLEGDELIIRSMNDQERCVISCNVLNW